MENKKSLIPGIVLICLGVWFFTRNTLLFHNAWEQVFPILLLCFSGFLFYEVYRRKSSTALFWGILLFCAGVFHLLRNIDIIPYYAFDEYWPLIIAVVGVALIAQFVLNPREWGVLIPGLFCFFFGTILSLDFLEVVPWHVAYDLERYWPVLFIIIGVLVLLTGLKKKEQ